MKGTVNLVAIPMVNTRFINKTMVLVLCNGFTGPARMGSYWAEQHKSEQSAFVYFSFALGRLFLFLFYM